MVQHAAVHGDEHHRAAAAAAAREQVVVVDDVRLAGCVAADRDVSVAAAEAEAAHPRVLGSVLGHGDRAACGDGPGRRFTRTDELDTRNRKPAGPAARSCWNLNLVTGNG